MEVVANASGCDPVEAGETASLGDEAGLPPQAESAVKKIVMMKK